MSKKIMKDHKKILFLTHEFYPTRGGIATYVEELARVTADKYQVKVWAPSAPKLISHSFPFEIHPLALEGTQNIPDLWKLNKEIKKRIHEFSDAILYLPEPGPILLCMYLSFFSKLPSDNIVLTLHGTEILRFSFLPHYRFLFRRLLLKSKRIGVVSNYNKEMLLNRYPEVEDKVRVVPGGLKHDFSDVIEVDRYHTKVRLITVGRIHPRKGQLAVVEAIGLLPENIRDNIDYYVVGPIVNEAYYEEIEQLSNEFGVNTFFKHELNDASLANEYSNADIFIMSSMPYRNSIEGFGLVYLEAGACGLPVIAHKIGGVSEAVRHESTGLLVDHDQRQDLSDAILRLYNNPALRKEFGENGRKRAKEISWTKNSELLFDDL
jgi:phosphatidyl-myo-inositol dimannoside synthase